jgi:hypothetical protein
MIQIVTALPRKLQANAALSKKSLSRLHYAYSETVLNTWSLPHNGTRLSHERASAGPGMVPGADLL